MYALLTLAANQQKKSSNHLVVCIKHVKKWYTRQMGECSDSTLNI